MTRKAVLAGFAALACLWFAAMSFQGQRLPEHTAAVAVPELGLTVTAELFTLSPLTEYERRLTLAADDGAALRVRMADVRGPTHRTSLYRVGGTEIAVLGPAGDDHFFATEPLRRLDAPSRPSEEWTYLGAFTLHTDPKGSAAGGPAQVFAFVPAAPEAEVSVPPAPERVDQAALRTGSAGGSCPLPGPMEGGGGPLSGGGRAPRG